MVLSCTDDTHVRLFDFYTRDTVRIENTDVVYQVVEGRHSGGDCGVIRTFCRYITGDYHGNSLTNIDTSIESHLIAFAAEESRVNHTAIDIKEYKQRSLDEREQKSKAKTRMQRRLCWRYLT